MGNEVHHDCDLAMVVPLAAAAQLAARLMQVSTSWGGGSDGGGKLPTPPPASLPIRGRGALWHGVAGAAAGAAALLWEWYAGRLRVSWAALLGWVLPLGAGAGAVSHQFYAGEPIAWCDAVSHPPPSPPPLLS